MHRRLLVVAALLLAVVTPVPASASASHTSLTVTPTTARAGSAVVLTGTVTPRVAQTILVQRFVARHWVTLTHVRTSGSYRVTAHAPHTAQTWQLRAVGRATSRTVRVHVVTRQFIVRASVTSASPLTVTGTVTPKTTGTVALQALQHNTWHTLATAHLTKTGTFTLSQVEPAGPYTLRVTRAQTIAVAAGTSKTLHATVPLPVVPTTPPPTTSPTIAAPIITTTALPRAVAGIAYTATLSASGGTPPYTWTAAAGTLPSGLQLTSTGGLTGLPSVRAVGPSTILVTVTDAAGRATTAGLVVDIRTGSGHAWGFNSTGQLGNNDFFSSATPLAVTSPAGVSAMAGGQATGYALAADGQVWAWGLNSSGEAGINSVAPSVSFPTPISTLSGVTAIAAGKSSAYALKSDGTVWAWGFNHNGELGVGGMVNSVLPVQVRTVTHVVAIAALAQGGYALESDGSVWGWGDDTAGDLGAGAPSPAYAPLQVAGVSAATAIAAGVSTGYALLANGSVVAWGANNVGQLGTGNLNPSAAPVTVVGPAGATAVAAGGQSAYAVQSGSVWAWGNNNEGEMGNGTTGPYQAAPAPVPNLTGVIAIAGGAFTGYAAKEDGTAWSWGDNAEDELGNGTTTPGLTPTQVSGLTGVVSIASGVTAIAGYAATTS